MTDLPKTAPNTAPQTAPDVCDYEGSTYRVDFWEGKGRGYEDAVERIALRRLLPARARRYVDFGVGFGRLINEADAYDQVVLMDYSRTMLQDAQSRLGRSPRLIYVAADLYRLPFAANSFDAGIMCRVIHHLADAPAALKNIQACFAPGGTFVLEFANKLNLKAIVRYALRLQAWSPYSRDPVEFVKLNFDFHPAYIGEALVAAGFRSGRRLAVSWLRLGLFKRLLPLKMMAGIDALLQHLGGVAPLSPSLWLETHVAGSPADLTPTESLFVCPISRQPLQREGDVMISPSGGYRWAVRDGIYDFKEPL